MRPTPSLLLPVVLLLLLATACEDSTLEAESGPAAGVFERGHIYIHPEEQQLYAVDAAKPEEPFLLTKAGPVKAFGLSRNARQVAFITKSTQVQGEQLYVVPAQGGVERLLVPAGFVAAGGALAAPSFSPSGKQVAFAYGQGQGFGIGVVNVDGSGLRRVNFNAGNFLSPNFKTEQSLWVVSLEGGRMALQEMDMAMGGELGRKEALGLVPLAASSRLVLSPDGSHVAWSAVGSKGERIFVWGLETGAVWQLTEPGSGAADSLPFWKDNQTLLWTRQKAGVFQAWSAAFKGVNVAGELELEEAAGAVYGAVQ